MVKYPLSRRLELTLEMLVALDEKKIERYELLKAKRELYEHVRVLGTEMIGAESYSYRRFLYCQEWILEDLMKSEFRGNWDELIQRVGN